jgi:Helix-turn-helix domain
MRKATKRQRPEPPLTMSVPAAGRKYLGLSRHGSYDAARRGDIPVVKVGKLLRVPVRAMERMLDEAGKREAAAV